MGTCISIKTDLSEKIIEAWGQFVDGHPRGNLFQSFSMYKCYLHTKGHLPLLLFAYDKDEFVGVLLADIISDGGAFKKWLTTRSVIIGGPLVKDNNARIVEELLHAYNEKIDKRVIYTQIRNQFDQLPINDSFQHNGYKFEPHLNFLVSLDSEENIWGRMGKGRTKQIKKAQKNGLAVSAHLPGEISNELIEKGYDVIRDVYRHAGLPLTSKELMMRVNEASKLVLFFVKDQQGSVLGCRFALLSGRCLYGWYAGSYRKYLNLYPNDLLIWETLKWGCNHHFEYFDYGGAGNPNKPYGVRDFKAQVGGQLVNFGRYQCVHDKLRMFIGTVGMSYYKKLRKK